MAEVQIPMALGNRIIFVKNVKAKPSSHRSRTPGFLRIAPIDSGQQITELGRGDRHRAVGRARPQKAAPFQPLRKQAGSLAVMPDHLQKIAPASTKAKQLPAQRITSQHLLHLQRQARKALPHVGVTGRQPHPDAARNWDHGRVSSPRMIRSRVSTSMSQSTITRRPFALTISIRPQPGSLRFSGCSATIIAGTNPRVSPSCPSRYALRQPNSSWLEIPCRRAVADPTRQPKKLSSTIRIFSAAAHRRRRPVSTISRRLIWRVSVRSSIPTISYRPANSTRRPTSDEYVSPAQGPRPDHQSGLHRDEGRRRVQGQDDGAGPALADRLHLPEGDWLGLVLLVDRARRLLPLHRCLEALHHDESRGCHRHLGVGSAGIGAGPDQRGTSASSAIRQRAELRLGGVGGMARQTRHAAYPRRALSSDDTGEDRALASDAQEPHPAGELLSARPYRGSDRSLRRPLQSPALPREHRQSDAGRCLLRTRSNHPAGKRKDQTQNHPTPTLASQNSRSLKSNRMRQNLP